MPQDPHRRRLLTATAGLSAGLLSAPTWACGQTLELLRVLQPGRANSARTAQLGKPGMAVLLFDHLEAQVQALGCKVSFHNVPRARQLKLFLRGETDFFYPANRAPDRDAAGDFVPLYRTRPMLLSPRPLPTQVQDAGSLLATPLRIASVRGVDYGGATQALQRQLLLRKRWVWEAEVNGLLRALREGLADAALLSPPLLIGTPELQQTWHWTALPELNWRDIGVHISLRIEPALRKQLQQRLAQSGPSLRERVQRHAAPALLSPAYIAFL